MSGPPNKLPLRLTGNKPTAHECPSESLNWSAFETQLFHNNCAHAAHQSELIAELNRKLNPKPESNYTPVWASLRKWCTYDATASIIACSTFSRRDDFIRCGFTFGPFRFSCRSVLCPRCSFTMYGKPLVEEFAK
jgi:hypothetical protein